MPPLTPEQKQEICRASAIGVVRGTVARYVGCGERDLEAALRDDPQYARELHRAEAAVELLHMRTVQQAAREDRQWRASVWWLERLAPERYARRAADAVSRAELRRLLAVLTQAVASSVSHAADRVRLVDQLNELADTEESKLSVDTTEHDAPGAEADP